MPTLLQAIGEVLRSEFVERGPIVLEETNPESRCERIKLDKSGQAIVLKPDKRPPALCERQGCQLSFRSNDRLFPLFRLDVLELTAICDYLVFCEEKVNDRPTLFVLSCELKSNKLAGARRQAENGRLLADYIIAVAKHHGKIHAMPEIKHRGLIFYPQGQLPKGSLHRFRCAYAPQPEGWADMPFAYYRCGADYPLSHFFA